MKFSFKRKRIKDSENNSKLKGTSFSEPNKRSYERSIGKENLEEKTNFKKEGNLSTQKELEESNQKEKEVQSIKKADPEEICEFCKEKLDEWKKPNWKWNIERDTKLCPKCYTIKEKEYEKLLNYCTLCDSKLKFFRYNPKPQWKIKGQLCRRCWDSKNNQYKDTN